MSRAVLTPRRLRAARQAQKWAEVAGHVDLALVSFLEDGCADAADSANRDLTAAEVATGCESLVAQWQHERDQAAAQRAIASAREEQFEQERIAYLQRRQAEYRLTADQPRRSR